MSTANISSQCSQPVVVLVLCLFLGGAGILVYANSMQNEFVFDDQGSIIENPNIRHLWPPSKSLTGPPGSASNSRPVVAFSLALNFALSGLNVFGYHLFNVAVHLIAAWTLFALACRTFATAFPSRLPANQATLLAAATALIWLVHPLQTAALNHVVYRNEALASTFYLLTILATTRAADSARHQTAWSVVAVIACFLGVGSKEIMVTAPLVVLLYDRAFLAGSFVDAWRIRARLYVGLACSWIPLTALVATGDRGSSVGLDIEWVAPLEYARTQIGVVVHYLRLVFWPEPLVLDYGWTVTRDIKEVFPQALVLLALLVATMWALMRAPRWGFLGAWFCLVLSPTSSFIPLSGAICAEHRMYLPLAPVVMLTLSAVTMLLPRPRVSRMAFIPAALLLLVIVTPLALKTVRRNRDFATAHSIWTDTIAKRPTNAWALNNFGVTLMKAGRLQEAIGHYENALEIRPQFANARANLATAWMRAGDLGKAKQHYEQALQLEVDFPNAHSNLASVLLREGNVEEAKAHLFHALRIDPEYGMAHYNLGHVYLKQMKTQSALESFERAAQRLPHFAEAEHNLAAIYLQKGEYVRALHHYRKTLSIDAEHVGALNNMAWVLATVPDAKLRNGSQAVEFAETAIRVSGKVTASSLDTWAAALAEAGRFEEAIRATEQALQMARDSEDQELQKKLESRRELYRSRRQYRMSRPGGS